MKKKRARRVLLLLVLWIGLASCPSGIYSGDPLTVQDTAANLLATGHLDVPQVVVGNSGEPGAFFCQNPNNGRWYNKYGVANTFFAVPAIALQKWWMGGVHQNGAHREYVRLILLNIQNLILSLLIAWTMFELATLFTKRCWLALLWVLSALYATFAWNYLRAQTSEIWQWLAAMVFFLALCRWWQKRESCWLWVAHISLFVLVLTKTVFVLWTVVLAGAIVFASKNTQDVLQGEEALDSNPNSLLRGLMPLVVTVATLAYTNWLRFGDCFASGYTQWRVEANYFSGSLLGAMWGNLTAPDKSVFIYYPLVAIALFGWPSFWRRWRGESILILACFVPILLAVCKVTNWGGHWAYGPRYLLTVLPLVSLPAVGVFENIWERRARWWAKVAWAGLSLVLGISVWMQTEVNRLEYMTYYEVRDTLRNFNARRAADNLGTPPFAVFNWQMRRWYATGQRPLYLVVAENEVPRERLEEMRFVLLKKIKPNRLVKVYERRVEL